MSGLDLVRRLRIDTTPLRTSRDYRLIFSAGVISYLEIGLAVTSLILLVNSLVSSPQLWVIYVVAALVAAMDGLQRPP